MAHLISLSAQKPRDACAGKSKQLFFSHNEFSALVSHYSLRVAEGLWRDYALDTKPNSITFSIFRHSFDHPILTISKNRKGGNVEYILARRGVIVKRSRVFTNVLAHLNNPVWLKQHG